MGDAFLTGVEIEKDHGCRNLIVRNRSGVVKVFTLPGERESVPIPHGYGVLCWTNSDFSVTERWTIFRLHRR